MHHSLRLCGLALFAALGLSSPATAQQNQDVYVYSYPLEYRTQGQGYWGSAGQLGITPADTFTAAWNIRNREFGDFFEIETPSVDLGLLGTIPGISLGEFGIKGRVTATGELGFRYEALASGGSVDVSSPITVKVDYPKFTFDPNQTGKREYFPVLVSYATNDSATIRSQSPASEFYAYLIGRNFELRGEMTAKAFDESKTIPIFGGGFGPYTPTGFRLNKPNPNDPEQTLWNSFETTNDGSFQIFSSDILKNLIFRQVPTSFEYPSKKGYFNHLLDSPFITTELQFPVITAQGSRSSIPGVGPNGLSATGEDWFSDTTLNFTNLLTFALHRGGIPVPKFTHSETVDLGFGSATLDYKSFNVEGNLTFGLKQDFNFVPKPTISLEYQAVGEANPTWKPLYFIDPIDLNTHRNDPGGVPMELYNKPSWTYGSITQQVQALVEMPASRAVKIRPKVTFDNAFDHTVSLTTTGGISATLLDIGVSGEAGGYSLGSYNFTPVDPIGTSATAAVPIKKIGPYALGGFDPAPKTGGDFQVVQQDVALPNLDTFTPTHANEKNSLFPTCYIDEDELKPLMVDFRSAVDPKTGQRTDWPADVRFLWDGKVDGIIKEGYKENGKVVTARITPGNLTPGLHHIKIVATVRVATGSGSVSLPVERTVDFPVYYLPPRGESVNDPKIGTEEAQEITQLSLNSGDKDLYIKGQNIYAQTLLFVNGEPVKITAATGCNYVRFILPAKFTEKGGTLLIEMINPDYGGGLVRTPQPLKLYVANPAPAVQAFALGASSRLFSQGGQADAVLTVGSGEKKVTIHGSGFVPTSLATVNGQERPLSFLSDKEVMITFLAADLETAGQKNVKITNPPVTLPDGTVVGGIDSGGTFETMIVVNNPAPKVSYMSPGLGYEGAPAFTLAVNGSDFLPGAKVSFGGTERATTYVSPEKLTIPVAAADLTAVGFKDVTVTNPAPGGGASNVGKFEVRVPPNACRPGDVDNSGDRPNVSDAILALRHTVEIAPLEGNPFRAADVTRDGTVDIRDVVIILRIAVNLAEPPDACL